MDFPTLGALALALVAIGAGAALLNAGLKRVRSVVIYDFQRGLDYRDGVFVGLRGPGRYRWWSERRHLVVQDMRERTLEVPGQELLTADKMVVKLSLLVRHKVADPRAAFEATDGVAAHLYSAAQVALRDKAAARDLDALLSDRSGLAADVAAELAPRAKAIGLEVLGVDLRDAMLSGEMKRAYAEVFRVRKEGEAALERARAEQASLRSLANAARMLKTNPGLSTLRMLQTVDAAAARGASLVLKIGEIEGEDVAVPAGGASAPLPPDEEPA